MLFDKFHNYGFDSDKTISKYNAFLCPSSITPLEVSERGNTLTYLHSEFAFQVIMLHFVKTLQKRIQLDAN
jgi:hypothetical protein